MWVWDVYVGSRDTSYVKRAFFHIDSFDYMSKGDIERQVGFQKQLVEIDHVEEDGMHREIVLFLKLGNEVWRHYEPANAIFRYGTVNLNGNFEIIGGEKLNRSTLKFEPFLI